MTSEEKNYSDKEKYAQENLFPDQEENLQDLVVKWVQKMKELRYKYPEITDSIHNLQKLLEKRMIEMREGLNDLRQNDRDLLTLLIINEIHQSVDSILQLEEDEG